VIVSPTNGIAFITGSVLTIRYVSGTVSTGPELQLPFTDANGEVGNAANNGNRGITGTVAPSYFMSPTTYPIYSGEPVGAFTDSNGSIIGIPFAIGDGPGRLAIPTGATQLQLGINDDKYADNVGAWSVQVTGSSSINAVLPQFAFGGGWYSALYFTNFSNTAVSFPVSFVADNGTPLRVPSVGGSSTTVSLSPRGTAIIEALNICANAMKKTRVPTKITLDAYAASHRAMIQSRGRARFALEPL
jgi:hypothetical protein